MGSHDVARIKSRLKDDSSLDEPVAFLWDTEEEQIIVVANRGPAARPGGPLPVAHGAVADDTRFQELFSREHAIVTGGSLLLPPISTGASIWRATLENR